MVFYSLFLPYDSVGVLLVFKKFQQDFCFVYLSTLTLKSNRVSDKIRFQSVRYFFSFYSHVLNVNNHPLRDYSPVILVLGLATIADRRIDTNSIIDGTHDTISSLTRTHFRVSQYSTRSTDPFVVPLCDIDNCRNRLIDKLMCSPSLSYRGS